VTDILGSGAISYTPSIISGQLISGLNTDEAQQATLEEQLSTGDSINQASDNPAGAAELFQLNGNLARAQQYESNATDGTGWLSLGNSTMNTIVSTLQSVQQTVESVSGATLANEPGTLQGLAAQVTAAQGDLLSLANTSYGGQAIFAGTGNVTEAYDQNGNYVGGGSAPTRTVAPGVQVPVSVTGEQIFGTGSTGLLGSSGILAQIVSDLQTGTTASLSNLQTTVAPALTSAITQATTVAAQMGSDYQSMQTFSQQATDAQQALQTEIAGLDGTNVAQATTQLTEDQNSYQSALWATSQLSQDSLVQFLD
jgi:flagellar hook-associated protein 3 FlgL